MFDVIVVVSGMYRNKTFKLKHVYYEQVTPAWEVMKLHFPQECSQMKNRDVPSTLNHLHTSNDGSTTQAGNFTFGSDVISGTSNQYIGINSNIMHKEMNSTNSNSKSLELRRTNCTKCIMSIQKTDEGEELRCTCSVVRNSRQYRPYDRKSTRGPCVLRDKSVRNCTDQYVTSKRGKENHLYSSGTCEQDNRNQITRVSTALGGASNDSMCIDYDVAAIVREMSVVSPVSSLDDSFCDGSEIIENIPSCELDCSVMLEDKKTEPQEATDIQSCDKDHTQCTSVVTTILTPSAAREDDSSVMCLQTEEICDFDIMKELNTFPPASILEHSSCEVSDIIENIGGFELDYSLLLEDAGTVFQLAADVNHHDKDSTQFI